MLKITLDRVSKAYLQQWIFRDLSLQWTQGHSYAITGPNGAGKSTLAAVLMGYTLPTKGTIQYQIGEQVVESDRWYQHLTLAAPYQELIEEFSLQELLNFHFQFKTLRSGLSLKDLPELMYLEDALHKPIRNFSSGMKQRLRLGLAFAAEAEALFLDEPTSNLDDRAKSWYQDQLAAVSNERLVIIASNDPREYAHCQTVINVADYHAD